MKNPKKPQVRHHLDGVESNAIESETVFHCELRGRFTVTWVAFSHMCLNKWIIQPLVRMDYPAIHRRKQGRRALPASLITGKPAQTKIKHVTTRGESDVFLL